MGGTDLGLCPWTPTRGFAPGPHRLLKKAGENFTLGWALPNPPGAKPLDPSLSYMDMFRIIYFFTGCMFRN